MLSYAHRSFKDTLRVSDRLLIVAEVAERLRLAPKTVRRLLRDGQLHGFKTRDDGQWRVTESELNRYAGFPSPRARPARPTSG